MPRILVQEGAAAGPDRTIVPRGTSGVQGTAPEVLQCTIDPGAWIED